MWLASDGKTARSRAILVTARWGLASSARFTNWTSDITIAPHTWLSRPIMAISLEKQHGTVEDETFKVALPPESPFTDLMLPTAFPAVYLEVEEVNPTNLFDRRWLASGTLREIAQNPDGRTGLMEATCQSPKSHMNVPLGLFVGTTCPWIFGDSNCAKNVGAITLTAYVNSISGPSFRIAADTSITKKPQWYWKFGVAYYDALAIQIAAWRGDRFVLKEAPPAYWYHKTIALIPGCDKKNTTCAKWANISNFGGVGIKLPRYNPVAETR